MADESKGQDSKNQQKKDKELIKSIGDIAEKSSVTNTTEGSYDSIIGAKYEDDTSKVCDILNGYKWTIDTFKDSSTIPYCYLIEYRQKHNSIITNLVNSLTSAASSLGSEKNRAAFENAADIIKQLGQVVATAALGELSSETKEQLVKMGGQVNDVASAAAENVTNATEKVMGTDAGKAVTKGGKALGEFASGLMSAIVAAWKNVSEHVKIENGLTSDQAKNSDYLKPYSLLYWLEATDKKYVFPIVGELPKHKLSNAFGDNNGDFSVFSANSWINSISNFASEVPSAVRDIVELAGANGGKFSGTFVEKAKFFQYPQDTEEYTIQFPLINTVRNNKSEPEWMKNYRFIMLFMLRNMIFRKNNAEYYPPLFYDLYIPGVIRQPFCYVQNVDVQPFGMTRMKSYNKQFIGKNVKVNVPVPEMWLLTIKLKSLVPTSANMVLSGMLDMNIQGSKR